MEYFIVERGIMWNAILEILEEKVKEGVEVRVMYDGTCSMVLLPYHYPGSWKERASAARCFPRLSRFYPPTRITVTPENRGDRRLHGFYGGVNLADEYINRKVRFGHWKDTAVMLKGEAVKSFTSDVFAGCGMWRSRDGWRIMGGIWLPPQSLRCFRG